MPNPTAETVRTPRERVRLEGFEVEQLPDRRCAARVAVAWQRGSDFVGAAESADSPQGRLRCAADATEPVAVIAVRIGLHQRSLRGPGRRSRIGFLIARCFEAVSSAITVLLGAGDSYIGVLSFASGLAGFTTWRPRGLTRGRGDTGAAP